MDAKRRKVGRWNARRTVGPTAPRERRKRALVSNTEKREIGAASAILGRKSGGDCGTTRFFKFLIDALEDELP